VDTFNTTAARNIQFLHVSVFINYASTFLCTDSTKVSVKRAEMITIFKNTSKYLNYVEILLTDLNKPQERRGKKELGKVLKSVGAD
jgi:hypothetical protein